MDGMDARSTITVDYDHPSLLSLRSGLRSETEWDKSTFSSSAPPYYSLSSLPLTFLYFLFVGPVAGGSAGGESEERSLVLLNWVLPLNRVE